MFARRFLTVAIVAAVATLAGSTTGQAGFTVTVDVYNSTGNALSLTSGALSGTGSSGGLTYATIGNTMVIGGTIGDISLTNFSAGFINGAPQYQSIENIALNLTGSASISGTERVVVTVANDQFNVGSAGTKMSIQSQADVNSLFAMQGVSGVVRTQVDDGGTFQDYTGSPSSPNGVAIPTGFSGENVGSPAFFTRSANPTFTTTQFIYLDVSANGHANFTTTSIVAVPAPATGLLALAGVPVFGAFGWMRRRKAVVPQS